MGLYLMGIYRNPNVGVFFKANDKVVLVPKGLAETKRQTLATNLGVEAVDVSVAGSRLLGPLVSMNNRAALVSRLAEQEEVEEISSRTGMKVARLDSRFTAVGNLVAANDRRAIVSPVLEPGAASQVADVLGVEVTRVSFREYSQVGAMVVVTNGGAAVYPNLDDEEVQRLGEFLGVDPYPTSVNKGVPFVASGLLANYKNAVAGNQTTGPELEFQTRALKV